MTDTTHTSNQQYGYDDATAESARQSQAKLARELREQTRLLNKAKERVKAHRAKLDRMVATTVSAKPEAEDWYAHPGVLPRETVMQSLGIKTTVELHRLMERYRKSPPKRRRKS